MQSATVRISPAACATLRELSAETGKSTRAIVERAIEGYRRRWFLDAVNRGFAALRSDPDAWPAEIAERAEWDITLSDGLKNRRAEVSSDD